MNGQLLLVILAAAEGPQVGVPTVEVGVGEDQPASVAEIDINEDGVCRITADRSVCSLRAGRDESLVRRRRLLYENGSAQIGVQERMLSRGQDYRLGCYESAGEDFQVFVYSKGVVFVYFSPGVRIGNDQLRKDIFDAEKVEQRIFKRGKWIVAV
ncbi:MAG: hypothetical protein F4148_08425 [Caldilineaceae bacterium SB0675_bin_29]|uniref:Uncharacterized protein n=1 Tax=Caldilineaceae bacterium SB0675_bin_29 TaxID=2605266 RepID=A0A6B1G0C8_9CHLR|nr:hypothetical protein [Caldilineaceae bacterium SB0675_bin_29]